MAIISTIILVFSALLLLPNGRTPAGFQIQETAQKHTQTPISVKLEISKAPKLNETVSIKCILRSAVYAPGTMARIELPKGAILVGGRLDWKGQIARDIKTSFTAKIKFVAEGNWTIRATAIRKLDDQNSWGDSDSIYLNVTKTTGKFGFDSLN